MRQGSRWSVRRTAGGGWLPDRALGVRRTARLRRRARTRFGHLLRRLRCECPPQAAGEGVNLPPVQLSTEEQLQRLEAILFAAREPLNSRKLADLAGLSDGTAARTLLKQLNARYDQQHRAFQIRQVAEGFQMVTRPQFADWLRKWGQVERSAAELSSPALETLAVVAYRQPINKAEIEAIRGVGCGEMLRQLMERGLVRICGRGDELGRPYLYGTTRFFLQTFGLPSLDSLPQVGQLRGTGLPTWFRELETLESTPTSTAVLAGNSEELNVRLSAPNTIDALTSHELLDPADFGSELLELREFATRDIRNADEEDELDDEDLDDDEEEDDLDDEEDGDEEDDFEDDEDDFEDEEWEEVDDDDEEWEEEEELDDEEEDDEDWDDDEEEDEEAEEEEEEEDWE